jgi:hypothetical protein
MMASGGEKPKIDGGGNKVMVTNVALSTLPYAAKHFRGRIFSCVQPFNE